MKALMTDGATRTAFLVFFAVHIPITFLVDAQVVLPKFLYPQPLIDLVEWYAVTYQDVNMMEPHEPWFVSMVVCELLFQLPFFVVALLTIKNRSDHTWFPLACLVYGGHTLTTLIPVATVIAVNPEASLPLKCQTLSFLVPWILFPAWLIYIVMSSTCGSDEGAASNKVSYHKAKVT